MGTVKRCNSLFKGMLLVLAIFAISALQEQDALADKTDSSYVQKVTRRATFNNYSQVFGDDRFTKFVIDVNTDDIYFLGPDYDLHSDFVSKVLRKQAWTADSSRDFEKNYEAKKPYYILGYITEHLNTKRFSFAFSQGDKIDSKGVARVYKKLKKTFFKKKLVFRTDSPMQELVAAEARKAGVPTITSGKLYRSASYDALSKARTIGVLRFVPNDTEVGHSSKMAPSLNDIIVYERFGQTMIPTSGLILAGFASRMKTLNVQARRRRIPVAYYRDVVRDFKALDGKVVVFEVAEHKQVLRLANAKELASFKKRERKPKVTAKVDLQTANMPMLTSIRGADAKTYGTRTANLGEIASQDLNSPRVSKGFAVPFFYLQQHLKEHKLDEQIAAFLADERFDSDLNWRAKQLSKLRNATRAVPINPAVMDAIYKRARLKLGSGKLFVSSSWIAPDNNRFVGEEIGRPSQGREGKKALERAILWQWGGLWNYISTQEREFHNVDSRNRYWSVLIQRELESPIAGSVITTNIYKPEELNRFTIQTVKVDPVVDRARQTKTVEKKSSAQQVTATDAPEKLQLAIFDTSKDGRRIVSRINGYGGVREAANAPASVISETMARMVADAAERIRSLFPADQPIVVEWEIEADKVWIVRVYPYYGQPPS